MEREAPLQSLKGIGEKTNLLFQKLQMYTVSDLITCYPRDYEVFEPPLPIERLQPGYICAIRAIIVGRPTERKVRNLHILQAVAKDETGELTLTFFNMAFLKTTLKSGQFYIFRGLIQEKDGRKVIEQSKIYHEEDYRKLLSFLQPRYSLTAGLTNTIITKAIKQALSFLDLSEDFMPSDILQEYALMPYQEAIWQIHFPTDWEILLAARNRLAFDEFFLFILALHQLKEKNEQVKNIHNLIEVAETKRLIEALPYSLTHAQQAVWSEICEDLQGEYVMNRLVQGDVGSGKTIIAFLSLLMIAANGLQGAMMAPTEVLARQHFETLLEMTKTYQLPIVPVLLTGSMSAKERKEAYAMIREGRVNAIIGTHALIQEKVVYQNLALVITDEQHRFGVRQRESLAGKGEHVHVLVMSATPIPRTLAIILYGDLHISVIDELPANRLPIKNCVVGTEYRQTAYKFIEKEVQAGRQVYVICPMVREGELDGVENVMDYTDKLKSVLPHSIQVAFLHGKLKSVEKNNIMEEFACHNIDVLVSTTVIEVGINVPNATVMMVENAERFGLAQLHQLRGRVGRGKEQSYCIFVSSNQSKTTMKRLQILNESNDGFFIAGEDLKLRGPGDLFGIRQSGILDFKIGDIYSDAKILQQASECAERILKADDRLETPAYAKIKKHLESNVLQNVDFLNI